MYVSNQIKKKNKFQREKYLLDWIVSVFAPMDKLFGSIDLFPKWA